MLEFNKKLNDQLETVVKELDKVKKEREEKVYRKKARANWKRLPKRDPVTPEIYQALLMQLSLILLIITVIQWNV